MSSEEPAYKQAAFVDPVPDVLFHSTERGVFPFPSLWYSMEELSYILRTSLEHLYPTPLFVHSLKSFSHSV